MSRRKHIYIIFLIFYFTKPFAIKSFEKLPEIDAEQVLTLNYNEETKSGPSYYVLIYKKDSPYNELIKDNVLEYANLVRTQGKDGTLLKIYGLEYTAESEQFIKAINTKIKDIDSCPILIKVSNKNVTSSALDLTVYEINDCLGDLIFDYNKSEKK